jgi:protein-tyrosine phosphatase
MKKVRVLFVCLGNICRSPLAAAIFSDKVHKNGMEKWIEVDSCGTSDYHIGDDADPRTKANASANGISIAHCVRQLTKEDLRNFDFIFAMDRNNFQNIRKVSDSGSLDKIKMMRDFDPISKGGEVPDPYHGNEKNFQEVFGILDRSTSGFIQFLQREYPERNLQKHVE